MNQKTLSKSTGIRAATISKMYYEEIKRIEVEQINSICRGFNCSVSDLLEYVPDQENK
jgi:putative transcriptional regulator